MVKRQQQTKTAEVKHEAVGFRLTVVEFAAELVVWAAFHHLGHVFSFFVNRHGSDHGTLGRSGEDFDLNGTCLGDLAV